MSPVRRWHDRVISAADDGVVPQYPGGEIGLAVDARASSNRRGGGYIEINSGVVVGRPIVTIYASPDGARP